MATNRTRRGRQRTRPVRFEDLNITEMICLMTGWHPGADVSVRWVTWDQFFAVSDAVRDELMADPTVRQVHGDTEPFADRLRRELRDAPAGAEYSQHGGWPGHCPYVALRHSHVNVPGDGHRHEDPPDAGDGANMGDGPRERAREPVGAL